MIIITSIILSFAFISHFLTLSHIAQQQYYEYKRYVVLIINKNQPFSIKKLIGSLILIGLGITLSILLPDEYLLIPLALLSMLILNYVNYDGKKKIKPLVITSRIKRLMIISFIINFIIFYYAFTYLKANNLGIFIVLISVIYDIWYEYFYLLPLFVSYPIEGLIRYYYIKKANKKLELYQPKVIAITGSYGKTTTKQIIAKILSSKYTVLATKESYNTPLGISRTINDNLTKLHQILVLEVGVDKIGGMNKFKQIFTPDCVVITEIGPQHLSTFKNINNIVKEKTKLIDFLKDNAMAFINNGNPYLKVYSNNTKQITRYALKGYSDIKVISYSFNIKGSQLKLMIEGKEYDFTTPLLGKHLLSDVLCGICVGLYYKIDINQIQQVVASLNPSPHRMELKKEGSWTIIDDSYNSNVEGFINALEVLSLFEGKKVLITPCLVELGSHRVSILHDLGVKAAKCVDEIILINKEQTKPFFDGLIEAGFVFENIIQFDKFIDGYSYLKKKYPNTAINLLIANDLPDYVI
jgi:UDP-N-acetylmuramoyl-tripeptide--D-alanyl-D-alanine ligase